MNIRLIKFELITLSILLVLSKMIMEMTQLYLLTKSSLSNTLLNGVGTLLVIQSFSSIVGIIILNFFSKSTNLKLKYIVTFFFIFNLLSHYLMTNHVQIPLVVTIGIFIKSLIGTLLTSTIIAQNELFVELGIERKSVPSFLQKLNIIGTILGWSLGPILAFNNNIGYIICDFFLASCMFTIFFFRIKEHEIFKKIPSNTKISSLFLNKNNIISSNFFFHLIFANVLFWYINGIFNLVEVPYLIQNIKLNSTAISIVFVGTAVAAFASFKIKFIQDLSLDFPILSQYLSIFSLVLAGFYYLNSTQFTVILGILSIFGIVNGLFLGSQGQLLAKIELPQNRTITFMILRLIGQLTIAVVGLLFSNYSFIVINKILYKSALTLSGFFFAYVIFNLLKKKNIDFLIIFIVFASTILISKKTIASPDSLRIPMKTIANTFDPADSFDTLNGIVLHQVFDSLYTFDSDNNLQPLLAKNHVISEDGLLIKINLKENIFFTDGSLLDTDIVIESLERSILRMGLEGAWAINEVIGFNDFIEKKQKHLAGLSKINQMSLQFKLKTPASNFLQILASRNLSIAKKRINANELIGTGQFELVSRNSNSIKLIRKNKFLNSNFKSETVNIKNLLFEVEPNYDDYMYLLSQSKYDVIYASRPIDENHNIKYKALPFSGIQPIILFLNKKSHPFKIKKIRCDFITNFKKNAKLSGYGWSSLKYGLPFSWRIFTDENEENTKSTLSTIKHAQKVRVSYINSGANFGESDNKLFTNNMSKNGWNIQMAQASLNDLKNKKKREKLQTILVGFVPDYIDMDALLTPLFKTGQMYNLIGYTNSFVDFLLDYARGIENRNDRVRTYKKVLDLINEDCEVSLVAVSKAKIYVKNEVNTIKLGAAGFYFYRF